MNPSDIDLFVKTGSWWAFVGLLLVLLVKAMRNDQYPAKFHIPIQYRPLIVVVLSAGAAMVHAIVMGAAWRSALSAAAITTVAALLGGGAEPNQMKKEDTK